MSQAVKVPEGYVPIIMVEAFTSPPLATSNSPTFGQSNSSRQDRSIISHQC